MTGKRSTVTASQRNKFYFSICPAKHSVPIAKLYGRNKKAPFKRKALFLLEAGALTAAIAEEVQTTAADFAVAIDNDFVDAGRAGQESTFNADTVGRDTADGESGIRAIVMGEEDDALEFLNTFAVAFLDLYMNGDLVAGKQIRDVRINRSFNSS